MKLKTFIVLAAAFLTLAVEPIANAAHRRGSRGWRGRASHGRYYRGYGYGGPRYYYGGPYDYDPYWYGPRLGIWGPRRHRVFIGW